MKLNDKQLEVVAKAAAEVAIEKYQNEQQEHEKQKHDRRLRNVKLLLRNYRTFVIHTADIKLQINELNEKLELDNIDTDEFAVKSILKSKKITLAMVKFINDTLEIYRIMCEKSSNPEELRRYKTIYNLYISENKKTIKEISEGQSMHSRTVYKDVDKACETLAVLMFGVNGLKFS